jgi:RNA polymerase sigma factor (sigma-70 family)
MTMMLEFTTSGPSRERWVVPQNELSSVQDPLRVLFDQHYQPMVRMATALLGQSAAAEDVVQQAFLSVNGALLRLRAGSELAYLRKAVMNGCRSQVRHDRARKRRPVLSRDDDVARPDDNAVHRDQQRRVLDAIDALPMRQRQCLVLRYYGGLTDTEVAAALDLSAGSAKTHIRRGLLALQEKLGDLR